MLWLSAGLTPVLVGWVGCKATASPPRDPAAMLEPLKSEVGALLAQLGGGRVVDGPTRVRCNMRRDNDAVVEWWVFARGPASSSTSGDVDRALTSRRLAGWLVEERSAGAEATYRLSKDGVYLRLTYLRSGAGDVVVSGESECFLPTGRALSE